MKKVACFLLSIAFLGQFLFCCKEKPAPKTRPKVVKIIQTNIFTLKTKVLVIGDSHLCGFFGKHLEEALKKTKAFLDLHGVCGSSPAWWFNEKTTGCGYYHLGKTKLSVKTPKIVDLLSKEKPDVVLGANMLSGYDKPIFDETKKLVLAVSKSKAKLYWIGPPLAEKRKNKLPDLCENLKKAIGNLGVFVDSRPYTPKYFGKDGIHFSGKKGDLASKMWALGVFYEIQFNKEKALSLFNNFYPEELRK